MPAKHKSRRTSPHPSTPKGPAGAFFQRFKRLLVGGPRDIEDPQVFHKISLIAFMAWVGLGADGLSSSAYGPEESFRALGEHTYLAVGLVFAIAFTVFVISYAYSRIIEHFPLGGGGYVVATRLLGPKFGVVSGSALLIDYVLTISVSIAAGADAFFSFLPVEWQPWKLWAVAAVILLLMVMNLRGVKESITVLTPIFLGFLITHAVVIFGVMALRAGELPEVARHVQSGWQADMGSIGLWGIAALFFRAYSMGAGTYTGIEAVSNGLQIMREPKVETGKRTMLYMAISLAVTAGGIMICYLLVHAEPEAGRTMNAVLIQAFADKAGWTGSGGHAFVVACLFAEAALLFVAAQAGFIDGPRVMANMAHDSWLPHRFGTLSDRLTMQDGILLMSGASLFTLFYTGGSTTALVLMYSINVFITFCLTEGSMILFWLQRRAQKDWKLQLAPHAVGFALCLSILVLNVYEKFGEGGWVTILLTAGLVGVCAWIRHHYQEVRQNLSRLDEVMAGIPAEPNPTPAALDPKAQTAILLVGGYGGLGLHCLLTVQRLFPNHFKNFIFVSVGVVDSATFKGVEAVEEVAESTESALKRYVEFARGQGLAADYRMSLSTEVVDEAENLCHEIAKEFPRSIVFAGKLVFETERWFQRLLHNETASQLQRRLQFSGLNSMVLPVRVLSAPQGSPA